MGSKTGIEWTEQTWNPIVGCSVVSPGCTHCYAMRDAWRKGANPRTPQYHGLTTKVNGNPVWTGKVRLAEHKLREPLKRPTPTMYFVNSMGDLFHEDVPDDWIDRVFAVMAVAPQHGFQVLTKRAERMRDYCSDAETPHRVWNAAVRLDMSEEWHLYALACHGAMWGGEKPWPLRNVWLGVSAEDQRRADERIPLLIDTPAAVRLVSAEPLLGPIRSLGHMLNFAAGNPARCAACGHGHAFTRCPNTGGVAEHGHHRDCRCPGFRHVTGQGLDWIIVGGESGPGARPMHPDWARSLRDQCAAAGVPFFFKQWGDWVPQSQAPDDLHLGDYRSATIESRSAINSAETAVFRVGKGRAGRTLDGRAHNGMPGT